MSKNKQFFLYGIREYPTRKGCHNCLDCKHLQRTLGEYGTFFQCAKVETNNSYKRNFPYDNTKCEKFE